MNQPVTFFHKRQSAEGRTYVFDLKSQKRVYKVFAYSRQPEVQAFQSQDLFDYQQQLARIMQAAGPGGVIIVAYEDKGSRSFQVVPVGADAIDQFGVLRPGSEMSLEQVKVDDWLHTPVGTHLLVPVDHESAEQLRQMKGVLDGLPPDMESLILYSLRKPSLDARLRDLETRQGKATGGGLMNQIRDWSVPALLLILLALNVAPFLRGAGKGKDSPGPVDETPARSTDVPSNRNPPEDVATANPSQEIVDILQAVQQKADDSVPVFVSLRDGNFKGLAVEGVTEQKVTAALKDAGQAKLLALGLIKLEALRLEPKAATGLFGSDPDNRTEVKDQFRAHKPPESSGEMLAALGCAAFRTPGIPVTRDGKSPALMFVPNGNCRNLALDKAAPGLEKLLDFVQSY